MKGWLKWKNKTGITLIALIITIIIMLILVGATINFALNGGLINKAKQAAKQTQIQSDREMLMTAVIASIGLDGEVDFETLDEEVAILGFTGSNGRYTSENGNVCVVDEYGNIVSESSSSSSSSSSGSGSGYSSGSGSSSSEDADLAYLQTMIGQGLSDVADDSGLMFYDSNIMVDYVGVMAMGSIEGSPTTIDYPILYKGKSYNMTMDFTDPSNPIITNITENTANNTDPDLIYIRSFIGKIVSDVTSRDKNDNIVFNDSNIDYSSAYSGSPINIGDGMYMIYISYDGNDYSVVLSELEEDSSIDDYMIFAVIEGIYSPEEEQQEPQEP